MGSVGSEVLDMGKVGLRAKRRAERRRVELEEEGWVEVVGLMESVTRDSKGEAKASGFGLEWKRVVEFIVLYS